jgi:hypothetical protein
MQAYNDVTAQIKQGGYDVELYGDVSITIRMLFEICGSEIR